MSKHFSGLKYMSLKMMNMEHTNKIKVNEPKNTQK